MENFISYEVFFTGGVRDYTVLMLDAEGDVTSRNVRAAWIKSWIAGDILGQDISFSAGCCWLRNGKCFKSGK